MITAENLTKCFGTFTAIEDVSFEVGRGEIIGFLGPNGAGKSTTMRILAGVYPPTSGRAVVAGYDVTRDSLQARSVVGYFPERVSLYGDMTVTAYLGHVAAIKGLARARARQEVDAALANCSLEPVRTRVIGTLSKGYRQRVGIAQALVGAPRVLILDEPTAGLDPEQVAELRSLIRELRGERTVILSSHVLSEIEATCDRVIIINTGRVLAVDTPANLTRQLRRTSEIYVEVVGPGRAVAQALSAVPGVLSVEPRPHGDDGAIAFVVATREDRDLRDLIAATVIGRGWALHELRPVLLSLEEIFLSLIAARRGAAAKAPNEVRRHLPA